MSSALAFPTPASIQPASEFEWSKSITSRLADPRCDCWGQGVYPSLDGTSLVPCQCTLRAIYGIVVRRYRLAQERAITGIKGTVRHRGTGSSYVRLNEDFMADVYLCAKRALVPVGLFPLFRLFLDGVRNLAPESQAMIESRLGQAFAETALWPLDRYFGKPTTPKRKRSRRGHNKQDRPHA